MVGWTGRGGARGMGDDLAQSGLSPEQAPVERPGPVPASPESVSGAIDLAGLVQPNQDLESLAGILNTLRRGVLLLGPNANVIFANAAARTLIAAANVLALDGVRLLIRPTVSQKRLEQ